MTGPTRREFTRGAAVAAALLAAGRLPTLRAQDRTAPGPGVDGHLGPWPQKPVLGHLPHFRPVSAPFGDTYTLTYRALHWSSADEPGRHTNEPIGEVRIERRGDRTLVRQDLSYSQTRNLLEADIYGADDEPCSWTVTQRQEGFEVPGGTVLRERGEISGDRLVIDNGSYRTEARLRNPATTRWTVLHALQSAPPAGVHRRVDLLDQLNLHKPDHLLAYEGEIEVATEVGPLSLAVVGQRGYGIQPIHYLIDDGGRVQLVTGGVLSWALESIT